ncbi:hypothetical protein AWB79_01368 [Caballeronia hypogeia]|uniref:Glycosyltransferase RgtA/B/C/D-like domain-containing protein n=1 Tax=Caballeronia hypogeia TaxID=1777140 RepID=A0A157ZU75_9BURK|nr:hypothetical protein [Caballeronia hypogeia]SAK49055.1 hypothetical protein AWB79_01368 [Caballeronia hypogeia]
MNTNRPGYERQIGVTIAGAVILLAALAYFFHLYTSIWRYTMDDSFISFRYARNMVEGHGLRFNPTDPQPNEGFTSVLWLLAMAPAFFTSLPAEIYAKGVNLCFVLLTAALIGLSIARSIETTRSTSLARLLPWIGASAWLCFYPVTVLSVSGMETAMSALLVALGAYQVLKFERGVTPRSGALFALTLLAMGLARPDLNLLAVIMCASVVLTAASKEEKSILLRAGLSYVLAGALYFIWRWWYFASFLPLPFYIKGTGAGFQGLPNVVAFLKEPLIALSVLVSLASTGRRRGLFIGAIAHMLFFTKPEHLMGEGHRFLMPIVPILLVVMMSTAARVLQPRALSIGAPMLACLAIVLSLASVKPSEMAFMNTYAHALESTYGAIGEGLKKEKAQGVVAVSSVGLISYTSNWSVIDMFGLCNSTIAKHPEERLAVTFGASPEYIILVSSSKDKYTPYISQHRSDFNQQIFDTAIARQYRIDRVEEFFPGFYLFVLKR